MAHNSDFDLLFEQGVEIRDLRIAVDALKEEVEAHKRLFEKVRMGECLEIIPNTFICCGEGGNYCSASCKLSSSLKRTHDYAIAYYKAYEELKERIG